MLGSNARAASGLHVAPAQDCSYTYLYKRSEAMTNKAGLLCPSL